MTEKFRHRFPENREGECQHEKLWVFDPAYTGDSTGMPYKTIYKVLI